MQAAIVEAKAILKKFRVDVVSMAISAESSAELPGITLDLGTSRFWILAIQKYCQRLHPDCQGDLVTRRANPYIDMPCDGSLYLADGIWSTA